MNTLEFSHIDPAPHCFGAHAPLRPFRGVFVRKRALLSVPLVLTASAVWIAPMSQASSGYLLVANIPVGRNPTAIAISPTGASAGDAYVTNYSDGTVSVIDPSGRVIATISTVLAQTVLWPIYA